VHELGAACEVGLACLVGQPRAHHAREARHTLGAFGVATEPVQVVGRATRQVAATARKLHGAIVGREQREVGDWLARDDPGVFALGAELHADFHAIGTCCHAGKAARHDGVVVALGHGVGAQQ
jgi:hypothetical protein